MKYAIVTSCNGTKVYFNINNFLCSVVSGDGNTLITLIDCGVQSKIICQESLENIFDNVFEVGAWFYDWGRAI